MIATEELALAGAGITLAADRWEPEGPSRGTVLLLHGGGQTRHSWRSTGRDLAGKGWSTLAYDARGHGTSEWAADGDYTTDVMVADLVAVVETLPEPPVLVGASMGGSNSLIAVGEGLLTPRALVLVDVVPTLDAAGVQRVRDFMLAEPDGFDSIEAVAESVRAYTPHRQVELDVEGLKRNVRLRDNGRWYWHWDPAWGGLGRTPDLDELSRRMHAAARNVLAPTLVVRGSSSDVVSQGAVRELLELIPTARATEVADAGHMVAGDDNRIFVARLADFLDDLLEPTDSEHPTHAD